MNLTVNLWNLDSLYFSPYSVFFVIVGACLFFWAVLSFISKKKDDLIRKDWPQKEIFGEGSLKDDKKGEDKFPGREAYEPLKLSARFRKGLSKTRQAAAERIDALFSVKKELDAEVLEELEELLISLDIGVETSMNLIEGISEISSAISSPEHLKEALKKEIRKIFVNGISITGDQKSRFCGSKPYVIMFVGVNGAGKTTSVGKLAAKYTAMKKKVLIAAADTFRPASVDQLEILAERAGADIVKSKPMSDPGAVAYDSVDAAFGRNADIVLVDTAGRLHTKANLMEELKKIKRAIARRLPDAPHETLLTIDATTGQNAFSQAEMFDAQLGGVTGIVLAKLDGTAKGGIAVSISDKLNIPVNYLGTGEKIEDLEEFDAAKFVEAMF